MFNICDRFPNHLPSRIQLLDVAVKAKSQEHTLPILNSIISDFGYDQQVLTLASQIRLLQSRTAESLGLILRNRVWNSICINQEQTASNLYNCYESLGHVDWLLHSPIVKDYHNLDLPLTTRENLCMQLASLESSQYPSFTNSVLNDINHQYAQLVSYMPSKSFIDSRSSASCRLRVAWITSDISYHPVGRFLLGILGSKNNPIHDHYVVDLADHGAESSKSLFKALEHIHYLSLGELDFSAQISRIRSIGFDIAVDLSGWTSGHFLKASLQVLLVSKLLI